MVRIFIIYLIFTLFAGNLQAQKENPLIRKGNKLYEDGKFKEAEIDYRKALEKKPGSVKGSFNLGNSLYRQENYEEAIKNFSDAERSIKENNATDKSAVLHNLGNAFLKNNKIKESIEAYKQALRINPEDDETRYNLAYAMKQLQQQQQQQQQNQDNKNDKNEDKKEQNQQQNNQNEQEQQKDQNREKPQISKQDAERMLEALKNDEQKTLDKVNQQKVKASGIKIEKDW